MKNDAINKLTITIEAAENHSISQHVLKSIYNLENSVTLNEKLTITYFKGNHHTVGFPINQSNPTQFLKNQDNLKPDLISPENWDYWPG